MAKRLRLVALIVLLLSTLLSAFNSVATAQQPLRWHRCSPDAPERFQCATVRVPMDYANPGGRKIDVQISRLKATNPAQRRGVLLLNPGGPGSPGLDMPLGATLPKAVTERYDLIGFDPRGVGTSTPVGCGTQEMGWMPIPFAEAKFGEAVAQTKSIADKCRAANPELLPFITTRNTARDLDTIRAALGEQKISYYGLSYGTYLGTVYSQLFGDRVDRMVLDSNVDPQRAWRGMVQIWAIGAERGLDHFARWAANRDAVYHLGSTALQVELRFRRLAKDLDRQPATVDGLEYDGNLLRAAAAGVGADPGSNILLARLLRKLDDAEGRGMPDLRVPEPHPMRWGQPPADNGMAALLSVICGDAAWPRDPEVYRQDAIRDSQVYPVMGGQTSNITPCAFWPKPREPRTEIEQNDTPVLLVQNSLDPTTPVEGARNLHRLLPNSRMVLVEGSWAHGAYPGNCADPTVTGYLVGGELPESDVACRSTSAPGAG